MLIVPVSASASATNALIVDPDEVVPETAKDPFIVPLTDDVEEILPEIAKDPEADPVIEEAAIIELWRANPPDICALGILLVEMIDPDML